MFQIQKSQFIVRLQRLAQQADMNRTWWQLTLKPDIQVWDLYDATREVAIAMFVARQHDDYVATYIRLCGQHTPSKVDFLPETL